MIYSLGKLWESLSGSALRQSCNRFRLAGAAIRSTGGRLVLISGLLISGLIYGGKQIGLLEPADLFLFDSIVQRLPDEHPDARIVIVGITEEDIQQYGWPLSDEVLTQLLNELQQHQPRVLGLDLYRSSFGTQEQIELQRQLQAQNLIAIMNVGSDPETGEVPPPPTVPLDRVGFNDLPVDLDGTIRRNLLFVRTAERDYYSFGLRVVLAYLASPGNTPATTSASPGSVTRAGDLSAEAISTRAVNASSQMEMVLKADDNTLYIGAVALPALRRDHGGYQQVDDRGYQILLNYRNRTAPARHLSISQVLSGRFDPELVRDRIVLVGTTAHSLKDQFYTPYNAQQNYDFTMPGVVIHAQIVSHLLDVAAGQPALYQFLPPWSELLWLGGWCLVGGCLAWRFKQPGGLLISTGLVVLGLGGIGALALIHLIWLPLAEPLVGLLVTAATVMAYKLLYRSTHDSLTQLLNREAFMLHLDQVLKQHWHQGGQPPIIIVFLDIDRFKVINESMGHGAGDQVLVTLAQRLMLQMPQHSQVARVGGDEFALLLQGMSWEQAGQFLNQLQRRITEPLTVGEQKFSSTVSMGIAITQAGYNHRAADLLRDAHTAMYRAKALGRSRYEVFATGMLVEAVNRLKLESDLITALEKQEFLLYYQPIVQLATSRIAGFEALVRWQQQARGFVLPSAFIPVAEETGLIMPLGQWIFRHACEQLQAWHINFPEHNRLTMSINLSNRQFSQSDLATQIEAVLEETDVSGDCVRLEITESMVMGDVEAAIDLMLRLKALDLKLGIDDFGTGYSSLSYLHRFPMDTLKVDKSFVGRMEDSPEDREIVHTIVALGHKLGMEIVAEGIETPGQIALLQDMGCEYGQGYFFSKPLSQEDATALLEQAL